MKKIFSHPMMVKKLVKSGKIIKDEITPRQAHLLHMAVGVSGEAGELLDAIKKHVVYQKLLDLNNVIEELGDIEFYMEGLRQSLKLERGDILVSNMEKLSKRYNGFKYTNIAAIERKDKK